RACGEERVRMWRPRNELWRLCCRKCVGWLLSLRTRNARAYCITHEPGDVVDVQSRHELRAVGLDGLDGKAKAVSNVLGGIALGDQLQDLALAGGEPLQRMAPDALSVIADQRAGDGRAQVRAPLGHGLERQLQLGLLGVLEDIAGGPYQ